LNRFDASRAAAPEREEWVPKAPTEAMLDAGMHANSEWLNDNAPIGEQRYRMPATGVYLAMLSAAAPADQPSDKE
jgi:hypothetical protein